MSRELSMEDVYPNIFIHIVEITGDKITTNINLQHVIIAGSNIILREHLANLCIIQAFLSFYMSTAHSFWQFQYPQINKDVRFRDCEPHSSINKRYDMLGERQRWWPVLNHYRAAMTRVCWIPCDKGSMVD